MHVQLLIVWLYFLLFYLLLKDMVQEEARVPGKKFFVILDGETNGAHQPIVGKFKSVGQTEVTSQEESDYVLVFCPIASQVGTDIEEALSNVHADKPAALMVMYHTFDPDHVVIDSKRLVDDMKVPLTADFLFYEGKLLKSDRNRIAFYDIQKFFGVTHSQASASMFQNIQSTCRCYSWWEMLVVGVIVAMIVITVLVIIYGITLLLTM